MNYQNNNNKQIIVFVHTKDPYLLHINSVINQILISYSATFLAELMTIERVEGGHFFFFRDFQAFKLLHSNLSSKFNQQLKKEISIKPNRIEQFIPPISEIPSHKMTFFCNISNLPLDLAEEILFNYYHSIHQGIEVSREKSEIKIVFTCPDALLQYIGYTFRTFDQITKDIPII